MLVRFLTCSLSLCFLVYFKQNRTDSGRSCVSMVCCDGHVKLFTWVVLAVQCSCSNFVFLSIKFIRFLQTKVKLKLTGIALKRPPKHRGLTQVTQRRFQASCSHWISFPNFEHSETIVTFPYRLCCGTKWNYMKMLTAPTELGSAVEFASVTTN